MGPQLWMQIINRSPFQIPFPFTIQRARNLTYETFQVLDTALYAAWMSFCDLSASGGSQTALPGYHQMLKIQNDSSIGSKFSAAIRLVKLHLGKPKLQAVTRQQGRIIFATLMYDPEVWFDDYIRLLDNTFQPHAPQSLITRQLNIAHSAQQLLLLPPAMRNKARHPPDRNNPSQVKPIHKPNGYWDPKPYKQSYSGTRPGFNHSNKFQPSRDSLYDRVKARNSDLEDRYIRNKRDLPRVPSRERIPEFAATFQRQCCNSGMSVKIANLFILLARQSPLSVT